jgi:uncharacterized membrane protein HdeD (DUF308 family)
MADTVLGEVKRASGWSIALGIVMILAGVLAICAPVIPGMVVVYVVAWTAIFNGGAQIVYGFRTASGGRLILEILLGLLYIIAGGYILTHPLGGLLALTLIIASCLFVYGLIAAVLAFQMRPLPGWGWMLFDAIVTVLLGCFIWVHWPVSSEWVIGTLVGISFISSGISRLALSSAVRQLTSGAR